MSCNTKSSGVVVLLRVNVTVVYAHTCQASNYPKIPGKRGKITILSSVTPRKACLPPSYHLHLTTERRQQCNRCGWDVVHMLHSCRGLDTWYTRYQMYYRDVVYKHRVENVLRGGGVWSQTILVCVCEAKRRKRSVVAPWGGHYYEFF